MEQLKRPQVLILGVNSNNLVYNSFDLDKELTKVNPVKALTSGKITSDYVGQTVYISNSTCKCQEWIIIGINHDNTQGTVDLISKYWVANNCYNIDGHFNGCSYLSNHIGIDGSNQFTCTDFDELYDKVIDGFSTSIKSNLSSITKTIWGNANADDGSGYQVYYNGMNHTSKMAMPSAKELNLHTKYHYHDYRDYWIGSTYEYFLNGGSALMPSLDSEYIIKYGGGTYTCSYMLRDFYFSTGYNYMNCNGSSYPVSTDHGCSLRVVTNNDDGTARSSAYVFMPYGSYGSHSHNLIGIIRFAKK